MSERGRDLCHVTRVNFSIPSNISESPYKYISKRRQSPKFHFYRKLVLMRTMVSRLPTEIGNNAVSKLFHRAKITKMHKLPTSAVIKQQI